MKVVVDGEGGFQFAEPPATAIEALAAVTSELQSRGRALLSVRVNGEELGPEELAGRLETMPADEVDELAVQSENVVDLVDSTLTELEENLHELPNACRQLAEVFHGEHPEEGFDPFQRLAEIWSHIKQRESTVASVLNVDAHSVQVDDKSFQELHLELNRYLQEALDALKTQDCVLLGDLLQYELAPRAEMELSIVQVLREQARKLTS